MSEPAAKRQSRCRTCQAPIAFIRLKTGANMPVEGDEVEERLRRTTPGLCGPGVRTLVTADGDYVRGIVDPNGELYRGFRIHFSTCSEVNGRPIYDRMCEDCGAAFRTDNPTKRYCMRHYHCKVCGGVFVATNGGMEYCPACRWKS